MLLVTIHLSLSGVCQKLNLGLGPGGPTGQEGPSLPSTVVQDPSTHWLDSQVEMKLSLFHHQHQYYYYYYYYNSHCPCFLHKGAANHDTTRYKAPMFSFGTRHECRSESSGGSSYLIPSNITRTGRDGTPAFSLHSRPKEPKTFQGPGPGEQNP